MVASDYYQTYLDYSFSMNTDTVMEDLDMDVHTKIQKDSVLPSKVIAVKCSMMETPTQMLLRMKAEM